MMIGHTVSRRRHRDGEIRGRAAKGEKIEDCFDSQEDPKNRGCAAENWKALFWKPQKMLSRRLGSHITPQGL